MSSGTRLSDSQYLQDSASVHTSDGSTRSSFSWFPRKENSSLVTRLADSLLASILEITVSVLFIQVEKEVFIEIGCYFYRASIAIMEISTTKNAPPSTVDILRSLSKSIGMAKDLVHGLRAGIEQPASGSELSAIVSQLEEVIRSMGEKLDSIPSASFKDEEYAEVAIRSLSQEMKSSSFVVQSPRDHDEDAEKPSQEAEPTETDLYSVDAQISMENSYFSDQTPPNNTRKSPIGSSQVRYERNGRSLAMLPQVVEYVEPLYGTFYCPLTREIMEDPVTIETGATYDRKAIDEWFDKYKDSDEILCPSGKKLSSRGVNPNLALKSTIQEWKERNEMARIKVARAALSLASSENMVSEAIKDIHGICEKNPKNKMQVISAGMLPLLAKTLKYRNHDVRCAVLELLRLLAEDDENECKEMVAEDLEFPALIRMLSSNYEPVRHASLALLLELSKCKSLCEKIGSVPGAILMLITIKYKASIDAFASEKADEILKNLEHSPSNIKQMAENGLLEPLLSNLTQGLEERKTEMASYLGQIVLGHDNRVFVAEKASPSLIAMVRTGNTLTRRAAFKALGQISLYQCNAKVLTEAGIVQIMAEEMFTRRIYDELVDSKAEAASILANIFESGLEVENLRVSADGHTESLDYFVYNTVHMIKSSTPDEMNMNLIRILLCFNKTPISMASIVKAVKETEASSVLIELTNNPNEELGVAAIKLLVMLTPDMGHTLADRLCKTTGQLEGLVQRPSEVTRISEKQAISAKLLAKIPHQSLPLNLALLNKGTVPVILETISRIQGGGGTRSSRHTSSYLEGLVGILVRFTSTLYNQQIMSTARAQNLTEVFTELLVRTSSDEVQRLSAIGLKNLSLESVNLSKLPEIKKPKFMRMFSRPKWLPPSKSKGRRTLACPVHRGDCSSETTFCLVNAKAIERLTGCLDQENPGVVEAGLSALCTLLDDRVDLNNSVNMLSDVNIVQHVLNVVKDHQQEGLLQKAFWMIEKLLMIGGDRSAGDISQDRFLPSTLVTALQNGKDDNTRRMAERILRHLNRMPGPNTAYYTM